MQRDASRAGRRLFASPEDDERRAGETEEEHVDCDDVVEDLIVLARERDGRGPHALEHDRDDGDARARVELAHGAKEHAITSHRVVDARSRENTLTKKADG